MNPRRFISPGMAVSLLLLLAGPVTAPAAARDDEPIRVDARAVEANEKTGAMIYRGDVVVEQGALSIRADRIEVTTRQGKTERVRATGKPARLRQRGAGDGGDILAEAERVDYHVARRRVDLAGRVTLRRGEDLFTAERLHYDLESGTLNAAGDAGDDSRVHAVIHPAGPETPAPPP